jgi:uncharacterized membrane protein
MVRVLARGNIGKWETRVYTAIFFLPFFFGLFLSSTVLPVTFSFGWGEPAYIALTTIAFTLYLCVPFYFSKGKPNKKEYANYFVALNVPIVLVTMALGFLTDLPFMIMNKTFVSSVLISLPHFLLMIPTLVIQPFLMAYFIKRIIRIKEGKIILKEKIPENAYKKFK